MLFNHPVVLLQHPPLMESQSAALIHGGKKEDAVWRELSFHRRQSDTILTARVEENACEFFLSLPQL